MDGRECGWRGRPNLAASEAKAERILAVEDAPWRFFVSLSVGEINQSTNCWPLFLASFFLEGKPGNERVGKSG